MIRFNYHRLLIGIIALLACNFLSICFSGSVQAFSPSTGDNVKSLLNNPTVTGFHLGKFSTGDTDSAGHTTGYGYFGVSISFKDGRSVSIDEAFHCIQPTLANPSNKTYSSWSAKVTKVTSDWAYIGIRINTDSWAQDLYGVIKTPLDHMTSYHSHSSITVSDGSSNKTVNSGWDRFSSGNFQTKKSSVSVSFAHQLGRRADSENVKSNNIGWELFGKLQSSWSSGVSGNQSFSSNYNTQVNTNSHNASVSKGDTKTFCQGLRHRIRVDVNNNGDAVSSQPDTRKSTSEACISVTNISGTERDPGITRTYPSYIGESATIQYGAGQYRAYFYVNNTTAVGQVGTSTQAGDTQPYGTMSRDANPPALPNAKDVICGHYPIPGKNGVCNDGVDSLVIPDNLNYVGAKICAATVTTNSEFDHYEYDTETRTRKDVDGNEVTETFQVPKAVYRYYLKFSDAACSPIAKKPNFRVTGGAVYTDSSTAISAISAVKSGVKYSSWSEYLTIAGSSVTVFGSGATFRGGTNPDNNHQANSPLTIANKSDSNIGHSGISVSSFVDRIRTRYITGMSNGQIQENGNAIVEYYAGDHPINHNITAVNDKQRIIFVDGNINISPSVSRIDAWLIATGTINTCTGYDEIKNLNANSCPTTALFINGLAYAKNFKFYRTVVGVGGNSANSAEEVHLPASSYVWAYNEAKSQAKQVTEVYSEELAPRV